MCFVWTRHDTTWVKTPKGYLSLAEAAVHTDLSTKTLRRRIADGTLPAYRAGRLIKVRPEDLDALFRQIPNGGTR